MNAEARDALPDLLHGRLSELDTATMRAHVESCADCRAELELMREVKSSARMAPPMDAAAIASRIPAYAPIQITPGRERNRILGKTPVLRIAAAAVLVALGGWAIANRGDTSRAPVRQTASNVTSQSPAVAAEPAPQAGVKTEARPAASTGETQVAALSLVGSTADLSDADLEKLAAELDGMESLPSAEPQPITITDDDLGITDENTNR